ncbi:MAG: sulfurtransferase TusA family protein [Pseudomonadales bacterium]
MTIDEQTAMMLDTKGLNCPMPLLKAKQQLNKLDSGEVLLIEATDAGSVRDFQVFASQSGHLLLKQTDESGVYRHWIKKS